MARSTYLVRVRVGVRVGVRVSVGVSEARPAVGEVGALLRLGVVGVGGDIGEIHGRHTGGVGVLLRLGVVGVEGEHALVVLVRARG